MTYCVLFFNFLKLYLILNDHIDILNKCECVFKIIQPILKEVYLFKTKTKTNSAIKQKNITFQRKLKSNYL